MAVFFYYHFIISQAKLRPKPYQKQAKWKPRVSTEDQIATSIHQQHVYQGSHISAHSHHGEFYANTKTSRKFRASNNKPWRRATTGAPLNQRQGA